MEEELSALIRQREAAENKLKRIKTATETSAAVPNEDLRNVHFLKQQLKNVENCFTSFSKFQSQIYSFALTDDLRSQHEKRELEFEKLYDKLAIELNELLEKLVKPETNAAVKNVVVPYYLPPLNVPLPTFDGSFEAWFAFKSMFKSVMARYEAESPAIKLYHLRNSLIGKAAGVIDQDIINNNDYDAAWAILEERFEDKIAIIEKHIGAVFELPKIRRDDAAELRRLIDTCVKHVKGLKNMELPVDGLGEQMLVKLMASRMDWDTRKAWEAEQAVGVLPSYAACITFLKKRCRILERIEQSGTLEPGENCERDLQRSVAMVIANEPCCTFCSQRHDLKECEQFRAKSVNERFSHFRSFGLCFNCSNKGHLASECNASNDCRKCCKRHNTLLHTERIVRKQSTADVGQGVAPSSNGDASKTQILLPTASLKIYDRNGTPHLCRALLDSCSERNFVTEELAKRLALNEEKVNVQVSGLNGNITKLDRRVRAKVASRTSNFEAELDLLIAPEIIGNQPVKSIDVTRWKIPPDVELADPTFNAKGRVDVLLGAAVFWDVMDAGRMKLAADLPSLSKTKFGWVAGGAYN